VVLLHDNMRLHTTARTRALLEYFNWELFDHPPYNPDLSPSYLPEELVTITELHQWWGVDRRCQNVAEFTGDRLLWHMHTKTYSPIIQAPQFRWWLGWEVA
jgi:hypothetical protein